MTLAEATTWRDSILTEMQRITKSPGAAGNGCIRSEPEQSMAVLTAQLKEANKMINVLRGPVPVKVGGIDADDPSQ